MKRVNLKKIASFMIAMMLVLGGVVAPCTETAEAASGPLKLVGETLWAKCEYYGSLQAEPIKESNWKVVDKAKLVSVKSSNKKIIKAVKDGNDLWGYYLKPLKVGSSKITVKYKYKGKTYTMSKTIKVKKYPSPYKNVKVNGKNVNLKKNKYYNRIYKYKKNDAKVQLTPKKGWKIVDAYVVTWNEKTGKDTFKTLKPSAVKKGTTVKIAKGWDGSVFVNLENSKGDRIQYGMTFHRGK